MSLQIGKGSQIKGRWKLLVLVMTLLASVIFSSSTAMAAVVPVTLNQPKDIQFFKMDAGETEMLIADSGNNRVIRATTEGRVLATMEVPHLTAATMGSNGLIYAAESGAEAKVHIFNPDGTEHAPPIDIMSKFSLTAGTDENKQPYIKSMVLFTKNNSEQLAMFYSTYVVFMNAQQKMITLATIRLDSSGYGSSGGGYSENSNVILGDNNELWYTQTTGLVLNNLTNAFNSSDDYGDLAIDPDKKLLYVVNRNQIMRTSYEGVSYYNRPVLSPWLSSSDNYPIDISNSIAVGPGGEVYMADTVRNRVVIFNSDGTYNRLLSLIEITTPKPVTSPFSKTIKQGAPLVFSATDFVSNYADPENQPMTDIRIISLPDSGKLQLNDTDVVKDQVIPVTELERLSFIPSSVYTGMKTSFSWQAKNGSVFSSSADVTIALRIKGDANGDGVITPADALLVNKYIKGLITLPPSQIEALDMNDDGVLDAEDSALIMGIYLGIKS
ncbi:hypothetical protein EC604_03675 [Paenibacillus amylolyticus]|uniref:Dockerin domain-containing protein n=1 Tax=Paenibacillus amylolyticus TaxID=1451 RepID=A0A5M9WMZ7_PAEAM|nr:dockerin type I domain-containing protein [Paenibacillus amylolyticus]KAA8782945.1 hypothetical protein EC604_03675 [Paenibacillus amylolyticus]